MTSVAPSSAGPQIDWRTTVSGGARLGLITAVGVAAFAFLSGMMTGTVETIVQSLFVLAGGFVFAYLPSVFYRPKDVDTIAWVALIGLMGALFFTVVDTAVLRPLDTYAWTWDEVGGGSGFWYIPVWFMGSAVLAWLGGWTVANSGAESQVATGLKAVGLGVVMSAILMLTGLVPFHPAGVALGFALGLIALVPLSAKMRGG